MSEEYNIRKTAYFIEIIRREDGRREMIRLRKASKDIECEECDAVIKKGENYIRDRFSASSAYCEYGGHVTNDICLKCWRGEVPQLLSHNRKLEKCMKCGGGVYDFKGYCRSCGDKKQ